MLKFENVSVLCSFFFIVAVLTVGINPGFCEGPQDVYILSDLDQGRIEVRMWFEEDVEAPPQVDLVLHFPGGEMQEFAKIPVEASPEAGFDFFHFQVDPVLSWSPQAPNLYQLEIMATHGEEDGAEKQEGFPPVHRRFGIRKIEARDGKFYVNNQPFYMRACGHEEESFLDTLDSEGIRKRLRQVRRYGFNAIRHHSHIPSDEYLSIADEVGVFIQMEIDGKIGNDPESDRFEQAKTAWMEMIQRGRRHPCAFIYSMGNEIYRNDPGLIESQNLLYDLAKEMDPATLVLNRSGSNPFNDAHGRYDLIERPIGAYEHVPWLAREAFKLYLQGPRKGRAEEVPIIAHEYPLVSSYPNVELAYLYDEMPEWLKITEENARKHGLEHLLQKYVKSSEAIQALCRKEMLEEARKFPQLNGYSMLRFTDRMERVSGVTTDFADPKNVTAEEFLRTNGETALLCTFSERTFEYGDILEATIELSHHGPDPFSATVCQWYLMQGPTVLRQGRFEEISVGPVDVALVGVVRRQIPELVKPSRLDLKVVLPGTRPLIQNSWPIWAFSAERVSPLKQSRVTVWDPVGRFSPVLDTYPEFRVERSPRWKVPRGNDLDLIISDGWQDSFFDYLRDGGRLWIVSDKTWPWPEEIGIFGLHITRINPSEQAPPVFPELDEPLTKWMTICSNSQSRYGNSGTIISDHPALEGFPHDGFCSFQFWPMIYRAKSLRLADFPVGTDPIIRTIDNFHRGRSKGYMAEIQVNEGILFVSTLNFNQSFRWSVSSRALFDRLLDYQLGPERDPSTEMTARSLRTMLEKYREEVRENPPPILDEMKARYATRWKWLMSPTELLILPIYESEGIVGNRLKVHWEYAQTQWYYSAQPAETIGWTFENQTPGDYLLTLNLASPLREVQMEIVVDDLEPQQVHVETTPGWSVFRQADIPIHNLEPGSHRLKVRVHPSSSHRDGRSVNIRDAELRAVPNI